MENRATDIFTRDKSGDTVRLDDPDYAVVSKDVPDNTIVGGIPSKFIKEIN